MKKATLIIFIGLSNAKWQKDLEETCTVHKQTNRFFCSIKHVCQFNLSFIIVVYVCPKVKLVPNGQTFNIQTKQSKAKVT